MTSKAQLEARRAEYKVWLAMYLLRQDAKFKEFAKTTVAKANKPIRTAGGRNEAESHTYHWFWGDAIWCGDDHLEALAEFYALDPTQDDYANTDDYSKFAESVYNEVIEQALPHIFWREIAGELGREPTTKEQRAWMREKEES